MSRADLSHGLVDLHSHVLPRVDDGAASDEETLEMLRLAVADGVGAIVATPHADRVGRGRIIEEVERVNALAASRGLPITVMPGSEVRLEVDTPQRFAAGALTTINYSSYLMIELPMGAPWPPNLTTVLSELCLAGAAPILAHAERYTSVQQNPACLMPLVNSGILIQLNAASLVPSAPKAVLRAAEFLLRHQLVHIIASDAHGARTRPPGIAAAMTRVEQLAGRAYAEWMLQTAREVIAGKEVTLPEPNESHRHGLRWARLLGRA